MSKLLGEIGTIEWARKTNGLLGRGERARYLADVVLTTGRAAPRLLASKAGLRGSGPDPSELTPPDTPFAREVVEACGDLEPWVVAHGYRCYLFARALGVVEGLDCDDEALFAAALLHDYAFKDIDAIDDRCFTLAGAEVAAEILERSSLPAQLQHDVLDAITLHNNTSVGPEYGALQHLLHDGVLIDVVGVRAWELDPEGLERVADRHPREGFTPRGAVMLREHVRRVPGCRASALLTPGFGAATSMRLSRWRKRDQAGLPVDAPSGSGTA